MLCFPLSYDSNRIDLNKVANHDVKLYAGRFTNRFLGIREAAQPSTRTIPLDGTRGYIRGIISCLVGFVGGKQSARPLQANVLPRNTSNTHSPLQCRFFRFRNTFSMRCIVHTVSFVSRICPFVDILDVSFHSPFYFPSIFNFAFGHLTTVLKKLLLTVTSRECFKCDRNESFLLLLLNAISMVAREWQGHTDHLIKIIPVESPEKSYSRLGPCSHVNVNYTTMHGEPSVWSLVFTFGLHSRSRSPARRRLNFGSYRASISCQDKRNILPYPSMHSAMLK